MMDKFIFFFVIILSCIFLTPNAFAQEPITIEFKLVIDDVGDRDVDNLIFGEEVLLSTKDIESAEFVMKELKEHEKAMFKELYKSIKSDFEPIPEIHLNLTEMGGKKLFDTTKNYTGKRLAIFIDNKFISAPLILEPIASGKLVIIGDFSEEEAKEMVDRINSR